MRQSHLQKRWARRGPRLWRGPRPPAAHEGAAQNLKPPPRKTPLVRIVSLRPNWRALTAPLHARIARRGPLRL